MAGTPENKPQLQQIEEPKCHDLQVIKCKLPEGIKRRVTLTPKSIRQTSLIYFDLYDDGSIGATIQNELSGNASVDLGDAHTLEIVLGHLTS